MTLSDEARLLIQNWEVYQEVRLIEAELNGQLRALLYSLEDDLRKEAWWDHTCIFNRYQDRQIYIANTAWGTDGTPSIWIGIENYSVDTIFGLADTAGMYLWVQGGRTDLVTALRKLVESWDDMPGALEQKQNNSYVVRDAVRKCLPDELDSFDEIVRLPILKFLSYFGSRKESITEVLKGIGQNT